MSGNRPHLRSLPTDVYRAYDRDGNLLYVGISYRTLTRLAEHRKWSDWFADAWIFSIESYANQKQARGIEGQAIAEEHPLWNQRPEAVANRLRAVGTDYEPFDAFELLVTDIWPVDE